VQILTISELLENKEISLPPSKVNVTFKKAEKINNSNNINLLLPLEPSEKN
jgi:hypothetical protein